MALARIYKSMLGKNFLEKEGWPGGVRRSVTNVESVAMQVRILLWCYDFFPIFRKFPNFKGKLPLWAKLGDRGTFSNQKSTFQT